jgi:RHS repeat-associated protein
VPNWRHYSEESPHGQSATTSYVYDAAGGLPRLLDDGTRKYVYGLGLAYTVDGSTDPIRVYYADGIGSVRALTNGGGALAQTYQTDAFGVPIAAGTSGTSTQEIRFAGEQRHAESGFVYLQARMYDPATGRFLSRGPPAAPAVDL